MTEKNDSFLLIIDGSSLLSTQFYGNLPKEILFAKTMEEKERFFHKIMQNSKGVYTNAIYGFFRTLIRIIKEQKPSHLVVTWDLSRNTFRRKLYAEYKAQRSETMAPLKEQFILCQKLLLRIGIMQLMDENYEADDFSGTVSTLFEKEIPVRILTKDNDYLQLVTEQTNLWLMHSTAKKTDELYEKYKLEKKQAHCPERCFPFTPELVWKEFGINPSSVPDLKGLLGDPSDNIKGVSGVGEKAATALIGYYQSIETLYEEIRSADEAKKKEISAKWKETLGLSRSPMAYLLREDEKELVGEKAAILSKQLATIKKDVPLEHKKLSDYQLSIDMDETKKIFHELEFKSLLAELTDISPKEETKVNYRLITDLSEAESFFESMTGLSMEQKPYAFSEIFDEDGTFFGMAFSNAPEEATFLRATGFLNELYLQDRMRRLLQANRPIVSFDIKCSSLLCEFVIEQFFSSSTDKPLAKEFLEKQEKAKNDFPPNKLNRKFFDASIAAYLLNPIQEKNDFSDICLEHTKTTPVVREDLPKGMTLQEAELLWSEKLWSFCCSKALAGIRLYPILQKKLMDRKLDALFYDLEMPLLFLLYRMEKIGIRADKDALLALSKKLEEELLVLEEKIYEKAGESFNINSPKQLGVILFEKLGLRSVKKTKSGYSTSVEVLEQLQKDAPIVEDILSYRQLSKIKSTYADALADAIAEDGRIHCNFNQSTTATGRLSCTNPNLQNIPVRTELGRSIRGIFVPEDGAVFVDADYSQIELRVLAAMSKDQNLIAAYKNKMDIHRLTASEVFHIPFDEVGSELRSRAKAVNFGIIYGISSFGLGQGLNISTKEAEQYIAKYFETYPIIKNFLDQLVENGQKDEAVRTMFGRIRPIPQISSTNFLQRSFGERIAMNSPIQGTAADIIKIAMLRVDERLRREAPMARLLLQVHDELLVEAPREDKELVANILKEEMEAAVDFLVPLEVEVKTGTSWLEAK